MAKKLATKVSEYCRIDHFDPYGLRKGSSTHASTATTAAPPPASTILRGEWSLGEVLDVYWKFAEAGDQYLGRILAGFLPNKTTFDTLPPHFTVGLENQKVKDAVALCWPKLFQRIQSNMAQDNIKGLLLRVLASIVFHSDFLRRSPFAATIPIFNDLLLLKDLKDLVTTDPSNTMPHSTGIPPHVETYKILDLILKLILEEREERKKFDREISEKLKQAIDEKAASTGQITAAVLEQIIERRETQFAQRVEDILRHHLSSDTSLTRPAQPPSQPVPSMTRDGYVVYSYGSKLDWDVPVGWTLPHDCALKTAFNLWFSGIKGDNGVHIVRPYKLLTRVPQVEWKKFKTEWKPIMTLMGRCPTLSEENISNVVEFDKALSYVLEIVSYIKDMKKHCSWTVATWSQRISRSSVMKNGSEDDKNRLTTATRYNNPHSRKRAFASTSKAAKEARVRSGLLQMGLGNA
jgi:hypothetical protein